MRSDHLRHCEERSDEAIQKIVERLAYFWIASHRSQGRVEVGSRTGAPARPRHPGRATFPAPSTSHAACGFPALRAPICFASRLMGPIRLGPLSVRRVALCNP